MYVTYTRIYGWSDYGVESSYQPGYRLENMMWMTLLVYDYIIPGDMYQSIEIRCDQTVTKKLKSAERGNYLTVILKEYKASVQGKEFRKPAGAMPLFEDHSDHLIERFRLVAEGQQSSSRI